MRGLGNRLEFPKDKKLSEYIYSDLWNTLHGYELGIESSVLPVLVGPSIDESTAAAAEAADIRVRLWEYDENKNWFTFDFPKCLRYEDHSPIPDWAIEISREIADVCDWDTELILDTKIARLFGAQDKWPFGLPCTLAFVTGVNPYSQR